MWNPSKNRRVLNFGHPDFLIDTGNPELRNIACKFRRFGLFYLVTIYLKAAFLIDVTPLFV